MGYLFEELTASAQTVAINEYVNEWDIFGECVTRAEVVYSLVHGGFTFDASGHIADNC